MYQTSTREEDTDVVDKSIYDDACEAMHHIFPISNPCQLTSVDEKRGKKKRKEERERGKKKRPRRNSSGYPNDFHVQH